MSEERRWVPLTRAEFRRAMGRRRPGRSDEVWEKAPLEIMRVQSQPEQRAANLNSGASNQTCPARVGFTPPSGTLHQVGRTTMTYTTHRTEH